MSTGAMERTRCRRQFDRERYAVETANDFDHGVAVGVAERKAIAWLALGRQKARPPLSSQAKDQPRGGVDNRTDGRDHGSGREFLSLFGGRVEGRQVDLVRGQRVVQSWRFGAAHPSPWELGVYSTVRFTLEHAGDGTRLVIDHTGIPAEWIEHIREGYPMFYQDPIARFFAPE